jgi:hypothetical protein
MERTPDHCWLLTVAGSGDCATPFCHRVFMETTLDEQVDLGVGFGVDVEVDDEMVERFGGSLPLTELEDQICSRSANLTAAEGEWLLLVAEFDRRLGWVPSGHRSCADWLAWQVGIDTRTAYEKLRVAHVLVQYPELATAMSTGVLPYAKARAITRIVRPDNIDQLLTIAATHTANQVENVVACYRRTETCAEEAAQRAYRERGMTWRLDGATAVITIRMPVDMASEFYGLLSGFVDCNHDLHSPETIRRVDALMVMADMATLTVDDIIGPPRDPRYLANLHLTPDIFDTTDPDRAGDSHAHPNAPGSGAGGGGVCCVQPAGNTQIHPAGIAPSTARRMLCDAAIQGFRTNTGTNSNGDSNGDGDGDGEAEIGTATPVVSRKLRRALKLRDGGCRFPGCNMAAWVDAHHIQHWIDLGPTRPNNLVCLCRRHHRMMHEGGWTITGDPAGELFFHQPDNTTIAGQPPIRHGDAALVNHKARTATQGRQRPASKHSNPNTTAQIIHDTERARHRARTCTRTTEPQPASDQSP